MYSSYNYSFKKCTVVIIFNIVKHASILDPTTLDFSYYATLSNLGAGVTSPQTISTSISYYSSPQVS